MTTEEPARDYALARQKSLHLSWRDTNLIQLAYLHGLEAGKQKWHDLRKDPGNLPKPNVPVLICLQFEKWTSSYIAYYRPASNKWQMYNICEAQRNPTMDDYIERDEVIVWADLPKFEEESNARM